MKKSVFFISIIAVFFVCCWVWASPVYYDGSGLSFVYSTDLDLGTKNLYFSSNYSTSNIRVGYEALRDWQSGSDLIAIGYRSACKATSTVSNSIFIGNFSGPSFTSGSNIKNDQNFAIGNYSLSKVQTGSSNLALGNYAFKVLTTGSHNVGIGNQAGYSNTTGARNIFVGNSAGYYNTTGSNNIYVGYGNPPYGADANYRFFLSQYGYSNPLISGYFDYPRVGIGTSSPSQALSVQGNVLADDYLTYSDIYVGDALSDLAKISCEGKIVDNWCSVDHETLPARVAVHKDDLLSEYLVFDEKGSSTPATTTYSQTFRSLDKQEQMNSRAVIQLWDMIKDLQRQLDEYKRLLFGG